MNLTKNSTVAATVVAAAMNPSTASAANSGGTTDTLQPVSDTSSVNLSITVKNGVATLFGNTESGADSVVTENLVLQMHGVDRVINLITYH